MGGSNWPNLFVVGASRAGTTSLWNYLGQHPDIFMSPVKEPHFFTSTKPAWATVSEDEEAYLGLFAGASERLRGEATSNYLWDEATPASIQRVSPQAKILISLRNPADRLHSLYWLRRRNRLELRRSFQTVVEEELRLGGAGHDDERYPYLERGFYAEPVRRYVDYFGTNVLVVFFEEFVRDARGQMHRVFAFLGVDPHVAATLETEAHYPTVVPRNALAARLLGSRVAAKAGAAVLPARLRRRIDAGLTSARKPELDSSTRKQLDRLYQHDREQLERLLGRPTPWRAE